MKPLRLAALPLLLTLLAFALRVWQLDAVPPGWSDDELSNVLVISQKVLAGDFSVYYVDATGLEALYHALGGGMLALLGANVMGIRLLSALLGTLAVPLTYKVGRLLGGRLVGLTAAALLAASFWPLMYSRINLRHILLPVLMLASFHFFLRAIAAQQRGASRLFLYSGLLLGISFYSYFAARGLPLILLAYLFYLALWQRKVLRGKGRALLAMFALAAIVAVPLALALLGQPGADARVAEVALPITAARSGDFSVLWEHVITTLSMFHRDGDPEFLYNVPHRPVFGAIGALFFWGGVLLAAAYTVTGLRRRPAGRERATGQLPIALAAPFLLLWWLAGITPGFLSVPPASLGHTIIAQPAVYMLAALPLIELKRLSRRGLVPVAAALLLVTAVAARDLPAYFQTWPARGNVRFLYHADQRAIARYLQTHPTLQDVAVTGLLSGPWDREALALDLENLGVAARPRWVDPRRAVFLELAGEPALAFMGYPNVPTVYDDAYSQLPGETAGDYQLSGVQPQPLPERDGALACFANGLCLLQAERDGNTLHLTWLVAEPLQLPPTPLVSKPPPPGVYDGPRLQVFAHILDSGGARLAGDDGLWVDPTTLHVGDVFRQQHRLPAGEGPTTLSVGLYDPLTGARIPTRDGDDQVRIP